MNAKTMKWTAGAAALAAWAAMGGCAEKKPVLRIYTWSDYVKPALIQRFERENGCRVAIDTYDSNETMYDQLAARDVPGPGRCRQDRAPLL